jgi:hypothetical protein
VCVEKRSRRYLSLLLQAAGLWLALAVPAGADAHPESAAWPRVVIGDPSLKHALLCALEDAVDWLAEPLCQAVLWDFAAQDGQPLQRGLDALETTPADYLRLVLFRDGSEQGACRRPSVMAFTAPGHRVVFVCGRRFLDEWSRHPSTAAAVVIHEALHTLGLGENPPSSMQITRRVQERCLPPRQAARR